MNDVSAKELEKHVYLNKSSKSEKFKMDSISSSSESFRKEHEENMSNALLIELETSDEESLESAEDDQIIDERLKE